MSFVPAWSIDYQPPMPRSTDFGIGLVGCGGITAHHLQAYRDAGWKVLGLCDPKLDAAARRRQEYYPNAKIYRDHRELLRDDRIQVVDVATHPPERPDIIKDCLLARKHVLSQKPFVVDLDVGQRLCDLADDRNCRLAVNQNGRFAPHFCYMRRSIAKEILGTTFAAHMSVHWDHSWIRGSAFEEVKHLILYDFAIHWFDMLRFLLPTCRPKRVFASTARSLQQTIRPNLLAQALIEWDAGQSTLAFDACTVFGPQDRTTVVGNQGTLASSGPSYLEQRVTLTTAEGQFEPNLTGSWFPDGFRGTMGELLCSIEEERPSELDARDNLISLALCFAAVASSASGSPVRPGEIRRLPN